MPFNGTGTFTRVHNWQDDADAAIDIVPDRHDEEDDGFADGLSNCITKDGQTAITANLPMSGFRHTGVDDAVNRTDYAAAGQVQDGVFTFAVAGGTVNAITADLTPSVTAIPDGFKLYLRSSGTNTITNPTISVDGLTVRTIYKNGGEALEVGDIPVEALYRYNLANTRWELLNPNLQVMLQDFRLTLTSATPVTTGDVTGATTIYCTPYKGNKISLYNGSKWIVRKSAEFSLALGTLTSGKPYDVFCYDNSGVPTLEFLVWTNDTTRATALAYQDGVLVKSGATTRRYLGTFYTTSTTQTEDSLTKRYLYNYYHRISKRLYKTDNTATWDYTTATYRQVRADATNQVEFILGVAEDIVTLEASARVGNSSANVGVQTAIGIDSTSSVATGCVINEQYTQVSNQNMTAYARYKGNPGAGRHYAAWLEYSQATGTSTWTATGLGSSVIGGITGEVLV